MLLALLGSGEFEPWHAGVDRWLLERARPAGRVLVLPTASAPEGDEVFNRWGSHGLAHFRDAVGVDADVVPLRTREDAERPELAALVEDASLVFFSGGNPAHLARALRGTAFWAALVEAMGAGTAFAGCSAGAACLGMLAPDSAASRGSDGIVWERGLGLLPDACVWPHWDALESYRPGLTELLLESVPAGARLLAVDERTALFGDGVTWRVEGAGSAHLREPDGAWRHVFAGEVLTKPLL